MISAFSSTHWQSNDGRVWRITEMSTRHLVNTLAWLRRNAPRLAVRWCLASIANHLEGPFAARGDIASWDEEKWLDMEMDQAAEDPLGWITSTAVYEAMAEELGTRLAWEVAA